MNELTNRWINKLIKRKINERIKWNNNNNKMIDYIHKMNDYIHKMNEINKNKINL